MTCIWPAATGCCSDDWEQYPPGLRASALIAATDILWALSGRVFTGVPLSDAFTEEEMAQLEDAGYTPDCSTLLRPCQSHCTAGCDVCAANGIAATTWTPFLAGGQWYNLTCGTCGDGCQCGTPLDELELPGPVAKVNTVWIDGAEFTNWALYNSNLLMRTDGEPWPGCQRLDLDLTEPDTWAVDYVRGVPVPEGGKRAAGILACEFAKACTGDKRCRIPANVSQVTRDGVAYTFDPTTFYDNGKTGIPEVDLWLSAVNPHHSVRPSGVYTPELVARRRGYQRRQPGEVRPT
ncbi:hypothetical protein ACIRLA_46435 [Streptomyces sp. NPDC102364]|uniref:hypothetical protein n=1 Tax=Streptomyces sp. NPDC102364 TaxID=3366161 RepID=UPI0037F65533